jgi:hypothetical protein
VVCLKLREFPKRQIGRRCYFLINAIFKELIAWAIINISVMDRLIVSANMAERCNFNRNAILGKLIF